MAGELRAAGDSRTVSGYAVKWDSLSEDLGGFRERFETGAFAQSVKDGDVRGLLNHNPAQVLARTTNGTLRIEEDKTGLRFDMDVAKTSVGDDTLELVRRGDITQMSFGFAAINDRWEMDDEQEIRTVTEARLFDVSPVAFPAYPDTEVAKRSLHEWRAAQDPAPAGSDEWREGIARRRHQLRRAELDAAG